MSTFIFDIRSYIGHMRNHRYSHVTVNIGTIVSHSGYSINFRGFRILPGGQCYPQVVSISLRERDIRTIRNSGWCETSRKKVWPGPAVRNFDHVSNYAIREVG